MPIDLMPVVRAAALDRVVTTAECVRAGVTRFEVQRLAREGRLHRLTRGGWSTEAPHDATDRHLLTTLAILRRHDGRSGAGAQSALAVWGLPLVHADLSRVILVRASGTTTRKGTDYTVWGAQGRLVTCQRPPVVTSAVLTTALATAVVHAGLVCGSDTALCAADAALRAGRLSLDDLVGALARIPAGSKGVSQVRRALACADGRHESPGESLTAQLCRALGYELEPQFEIGPWRADFRIVGSHVLIEFDGKVKYGEGTDVFQEKRREDDLRRRGFVVVRLVWADLYRPDVVRTRIEQALKGAAA